MRSNIASFKMCLQMNFTDDLPNGPYCLQVSQQTIKVNIFPHATALDLKNSVESFAAAELARQAEASKNVKIQSQWTISGFSYKGGPLPLEASLSMMKSGDEVSADVTQKIDMQANMKAVCCSLI